MQWMNQSGMFKITHKGRVKFSTGNYIDTVDCDVAPLSTCHLLLGGPWQLDLDATHGGRSNTYSFMHKCMSHVLKPMMKTAIKVDIFPAVRKQKKDPPMDTPKPRTALFQCDKNDVDILGGDLMGNCNNNVAENVSNLINIFAKRRTALIQGEEMMRPWLLILIIINILNCI
jgi:hypothetical protein